jgi:hypothetical protein
MLEFEIHYERTKCEQKINMLHITYVFNINCFNWISSFFYRTLISYPGRWLRITVFLVVTSPYTVVYDEIRHENGPYSAVILVTIIWHRIQHRILCRIRSYACRILITNGRKTPAWITVKIRCVNGPYLTVYGRISAVFFDQGNKSFVKSTDIDWICIFNTSGNKLMIWINTEIWISSNIFKWQIFERVDSLWIEV